MKKVVFSLALSALIETGCTQSSASVKVVQEIAETHVLHAADVAPLSPDSVIMLLKEGNENFNTRHMHDRDAMSQLVE